LKKQSPWFDFILKEWLLLGAASGLLLTSLYIKHLPYYSKSDLQVLFVLFALFVTVKGIENSGVLRKIALSVEKGKFITFKLVITTFFLSMFVTNDIALILMIPLTLILNINRKDIVVILEAMSANAGSALTPIGNPQNLFIYWYYNIKPSEFIYAIMPFSVVFLVLLLIVSMFIKTRNLQDVQYQEIKIKSSSYIYLVFLVIIILTVFHILPLSVGILVIIYAIIFDRSSIKIDYSLLFTFLLFFGLAGNMQEVLPVKLKYSGHVFTFAAISSQVMSNVPAALLISKFTGQWKALLWGVNVGGFGSLIGSFANVIAYKLYITSKDRNSGYLFLTKFLVFGYCAFFIGVVLYLVIY